MSKVRIINGKTIPWGIRLAGTVLCLCIIFGVSIKFSLLITLLIGITLVCPLLILLHFSNAVVEIDTEQKKVFDGDQLLNYRWGRSFSFRSITDFFYKKVRTAQRYQNYTGVPKTHHSQEYRAYINFDEEHTLMLCFEKKEENIISRISEIKKQLKTTP